jgi:NADH-quinone oxidoreductase subunit H
MTAWFQSWAGEGFGYFIATILLILMIALPLMLAVAMVIYADRKIWAAMALRKGPNVVGPFGLLQSFADGLKVFLKETIIPASANRGLFIIAPIITFTVALLAWAVIPFQEGWVLADINVGLLYILAISSLSVYGVIIAGWASNSKYPFYSALRAAAQMVSYEVAIGFVLIPVILFAGTFSLSGIVLGQQGHIFGAINAYGLNPLLFPMAVIFLISSLAETARPPFDLTEAESELVAGYQTEYSSMSFALFWLGEYGNVILMCAMNVLLFWGGWLPPVDWAPLYYIPGIFWFFGKILLFFFIFAWVKATVPRFRYDQLMRLGWKVFLPISLVGVFLVSGYIMLRNDGMLPWSSSEIAASSVAQPSANESRPGVTQAAPDAGRPTKQDLVRYNASDACLLRAENSDPGAPATTVFLYRPPSNALDADVIDIRYPAQFAGRYRLRLDAENGHGGSGPLVPMDGEGARNLSLAISDVVANDRNNAMLMVSDETRPLMGDCHTQFDLRT